MRRNNVQRCIRHYCIQLPATEILTTSDFTGTMAGGKGRWDDASADQWESRLYLSTLPSLEYRPLAQVCGLLVGRWLLSLHASHLHSRKEKVG